MKIIFSYIFVFAKGYQTNDVGVLCMYRREPYFRRYGREGVGFETGDFVEEKLGRGYRRTTHREGVGGSKGSHNPKSQGGCWGLKRES